VGGAEKADKKEDDVNVKKHASKRNCFSKPTV
jgi:hypothetical protein